MKTPKTDREKLQELANWVKKKCPDFPHRENIDLGDCGLYRGGGDWGFIKLTIGKKEEVTEIYLMYTGIQLETSGNNFAVNMDGLISFFKKEAGPHLEKMAAKTKAYKEKMTPINKASAKKLDAELDELTKLT